MNPEATPIICIDRSFLCIVLALIDHLLHCVCDDVWLSPVSFDHLICHFGHRSRGRVMSLMSSGVPVVSLFLFYLNGSSRECVWQSKGCGTGTHLARPCSGRIDPLHECGAPALAANSDCFPRALFCWYRARNLIMSSLV